MERTRCRHEKWDCHVCAWTDGLPDEHHEEMHDSEDSDSGLIDQLSLVPPPKDE